MSMKTTGTGTEDDEIQIDLLELFDIFRRKWWMILLAAVIGGTIGGVGSKVLLTPKYESTATLYVLSKETTLTSLADLQIGSQLTNDYQVVITSRTVLEKVIDEMNLDWEYTKLRNMITINNPTGTRILKITVTDTDPDRTCQLTNNLAKSASEYIGDIMEVVPPKFIEDGVVPKNAVSPNVAKNGAVAAAAGMLLVCGVLTLRLIMDDTIQSEDDVERYLGLSVLALIPEKDQAAEASSAPKARAGGSAAEGKSRRRELDGRSEKRSRK